MSDLITHSQVMKEYDAASSTITGAVRNGELDRIREGGRSYYDRQQVEAWNKKRRRRKSSKKRKPANRDPENGQKKSNNAIFVSLLMKIFGELSRIENSLSGQNLEIVRGIKSEILKTVQGVNL